MSAYLSFGKQICTYTDETARFYQIRQPHRLFHLINTKDGLAFKLLIDASRGFIGFFFFQCGTLKKSKQHNNRLTGELLLLP